MKKLDLLYEGKAKKMYKSDKPGQLIMEYKDDATAFDGEKQEQISNKGKLNTEISTIFFNLLAKAEIPTHFIKQLTEIQLVVKKLEIIPVEVVVRNLAAGSLAKRLGKTEGTKLAHPIREFYYKSDKLGDPLLNKQHILLENLATEAQLEKMTGLAFEINEILSEYLTDRDLELVDFKLEFGLDDRGKIYLADEITPDTSRLWDKESQKKLDKDRFRRDLGEVESAYQEVINRLRD